MKLNSKIIYLILILLGLSTFVYSKPRHDQGDNVTTPPVPLTNVVIQQVGLAKNNINSWFYNTGIFNQDRRTSNTPGFEWPIYTGQNAFFTSGLSMAALIQGDIHEASAMYAGEYVPGYVAIVNGNPTLQTDSRFKLYRIFSTDPDPINPNPDYDNWGQMVPYGAPYIHVPTSPSDSIDFGYRAGIDKPGIKDAACVIFGCLTDADPTQHSVSEGFGGGTPPMYAEIHITAWCYNTPGLEDIQFIQWIVINRNNKPWNSLYMGITTDPDLGCADDDFIGCDTSLSENSAGKLVPRNLGFVYNSAEVDCAGTYRYSGIVPSSGMDYFRSPIFYTGNINDTVVFYEPPGAHSSKNAIVKVGYKEIGMTSFDFFTNPSSGGPVCERDPNPNIPGAYNYLKGTKVDGSPWMFPPGGSADFVTKFCYPGDPETGIGWCEKQGSPSGSVQNCGGPTVYTGNVVTSNAGGDRRFLFNSGKDDFNMAPGDTQIVVLAQMVARGANRRQSVTVLKSLDDVAQKIFDLNFSVIPPPPPPKVVVSSTPGITPGTYNLTLSWGDTSEYYDFKDNIFSPQGDTTSFYKFEGYEVWEFERSSQNVPDLSNPSNDVSALKLIAIFDKVDTVGQIVDTFATSNTSNGIFPVVPAYKQNTPSGFPNYGITRSITLSTTSYPSDNNGNTNFIYGHDYKFIITAYGYNTHQFHKGQSFIRNSLSAGIINVHVEAPLAGTQYFFKDGDTLLTNRRDLGLLPLVRQQSVLKDAKYRVIYNNPDTTYNILRSFDNWTSSQTLKSNLKYSYNTNLLADDSSRILDGIDFKVYKIFAQLNYSSGADTGNVGVIKDPGPASQSRFYGWDYTPSQNRFVTGNTYLNYPSNNWDSKSMHITYPTTYNYLGIKSLTTPDKLRNVEIRFTGYGSGQQAYCYYAASNFTYQFQLMREVPFQVWETDASDSTPAPRQLNCAFLEFPVSSGGRPDSTWNPTADTLGGMELVYVFGSNYNSSPDPFYTTKNLKFQQGQIDVWYVWAPRLISAGASFHGGDVFTIYPYTVTRPLVAPGLPLYYEVSSKAPIIGNSSLASTNKDMDKITVVPNPYYGFNSLETPQTGRYVAFRRLPVACTVKIYTINGDLIRTLNKNDATTSELRWNLSNQDNVPVASGIYIVLVDAPGIGQKILKVAIFTPEERIDF